MGNDETTIWEAFVYPLCGFCAAILLLPFAIVGLLIVCAIPLGLTMLLLHLIFGV
jgi:hypothetical protein